MAYSTTSLENNPLMSLGDWSSVGQEHVHPESPRRKILMSQLYAGAEEGCPWCTLLKAAVNAYDSNVSDTDTNSCIFWRRQNSDTFKPIYMSSQMGFAELHLFTTSENQAGGFPVPFRKLYPDTRDNVVIEQIQRWLTSCQESHDRCQKAETKAKLPTRVLDLTNFPAGSLQLVETDSTSGQYACLSYGWGSLDDKRLKQFITQKATKNDRLKGIPVGNLPKTTHHAADVVHRLGIQYLWVDSLCIVQDDKDDWAKEASQMASIYSNGALTIAAAWASDADKGLFVSATEARSSPLSQRIVPLDLHVRECMPYYHGHIHCGPLEDVETFQFSKSLQPYLSTRGWCLQERLLSQRVVFFGANEIAWECKTAFSCYCHDSFQLWPTGVRRDLHRQAVARLSNGLNQEHVEGRQILLSDENNNPRLWHELVTQFMGTNLSRQTDRFPAFTGLAKVFETKRPGDRYLAGLWQNSLVHDLLWQRLRASAPIHSKTETDTPSWSWASSIYPVEYDHTFPGEMTDLSLATVNTSECNCKIATQDNPYGVVTSGIVSLTSKIAFLKHDRNFDSMLVGKDERKVEIVLDYNLDVRPELAMFLLANGQHSSRVRREVGLVLRRVSGHGSQYQRVGMFDRKLSRGEWSPFDDVSSSTTVEIV